MLTKNNGFVLGMHYTAMTGTIYYLPDSTAVPPKPALETAALIGIICAIIVVACLILLFTGIQTARRALALSTEKVLSTETVSATPTSTQFHQQLTLGVIYFDPVGRILVNLDGVVPMQKVMIEVCARALWGFLRCGPWFAACTSKWLVSPLTSISLLGNRRV